MRMNHIGSGPGLAALDELVRALAPFVDDLVTVGGHLRVAARAQSLGGCRSTGRRKRVLLEVH